MSRKNQDFEINTSGVGALLSGLSDRFDNDTAGHSDSDGTTARRRNGTPSPRHDGTPSPKPSKYTLLLDQDDALTLDQLALDLRRRTGRAVDKSEILRALIRLADTQPDIGDAVAATLDRRAQTPAD